MEAALSNTDYAIVGVYFLLVLGAGLFFSRRAARGIGNYFLGGRNIPWWAIGMSGSASNFDMTGTMVITSFIFAVGLQGYWVSMRGGMVLPIGILIIYMAKWLRRSNVMTGAEWMRLRFGDGIQGRTARLLSAVANLVVTVAFLTYFVKGTGKFLAVFLPFSPEQCSLFMVGFALVYTTFSGFYGVIVTDVLQEILILVVSLYVGLRAMFLTDHAAVLSRAGAEWSSFWPRWRAEPMEWLANPHVYHMFGLCIVFWVAKGMLEGAGGFTGGYMTQRYFASRNDREAGLLSFEWAILLLFRWWLVMGAALLGMSLAFGSGEIAALLQEDPERTLPVVLSQALPAGLRGLAVAGLIAAAMSTFDSTINAGVSYWVRDIYQPYLSRPRSVSKTVDATGGVPQAGRSASRSQMIQSYGATVVLAVAATAMGLTVENINQVWSWITGPLAAGLFAPIVLRWYWWRMNGWGFTWGTGAGLATAVLLKVVAPGMAFYSSFALTLFIATGCSIAGSLLTAPTPAEVLLAFWRRIRPFGWWGPVRGRANPLEGDEAAREHRRDIPNAFLATGWHVTGVVVMICLVLHKWMTFAAALMVYLMLWVVLYRTWFRHLQTREAGEEQAKENLIE